MACRGGVPPPSSNAPPFLPTSSDAPLPLSALERPLLFLYAALSAAYLLTYKDVWEHHFVLLLPPLVLLALRKTSRWLWLPPFVVCALPSLFAFYDLPHLGYNEEPQPYWSHAVSLIQHGWKPLAPLWLMGGLLAMSLRETNIGAWLGEQGARLRPARRMVQAVVVVLLCVGLFGTVRWVRASILTQRQVSQSVIWPSDVFQRQQHDNTCGPAALAAVCRHYGVAATEDEIARLAGTTAAGTSMLGLQRAAEAEGLATQAWQMSPEGLRHAPWPCILFFHAGHFAVLTGVVGDHFYLADPSLGQHAWTEQELAQNWRGEVLAVGPSEELKARQRR